MEYSNQTIEDLMLRFEPQMGEDYQKYKNHLYRVFFNCLMIDEDKDNEEKYAIAAVFHDIGIWTDHTIDYLDPSIKRAKEYLTEIGKEDWAEEIGLMIDEHHKISGYKGKYEETVEVFRRADWIDVSLGMKTFSAERNSIKEIKKNFPNLGFHTFLMKGTIKNFFRHPLNPLPMFKR